MIGTDANEWLEINLKVGGFIRQGLLHLKDHGAKINLAFEVYGLEGVKFKVYLLMQSLPGRRRI